MAMDDLDRAKLIETFRTESEEGLASMEESLLLLERQPGDKEALQTIRRAIHTIKGSGSCLGFAVLPQFAHGVEDALAQAGENTLPGDLVNLLLQSVDVLRKLVLEASADRDAPVPGQGDLLGRLCGPAAAPNVVGGEGTPAKEEPKKKDSARTLRVDVETLDRLLNLTGEIAIARGHLTRALEEKTAGIDALLEKHREADRLYVELQEQVMKARLVRVGPLLRPLVRMVRDIALSHGKQAQLRLVGEEVEVDTKIIQSLRDPLTHMIRNALAHGIETPEVRRAAGKDPVGTLTLSARHDGGSIVVELSDDGAGFNRARILERARTAGLIGETEMLSDEEICNLVFRSGLSTAENVTDLSGRGVGMDVVLRDIEGLRGTVAIQSRPGKGSTIALRLPLTLAIIDGFEVGAAGESYIIPMDAVRECLEMPEEHLGHAGSGIVNLRGRAMPFARLRALFGLGGAQTPRESVVVVQHTSGQVGLAVDALLGERQAVVKPLGRTFQAIAGVSGSTILGDGRIALILDVPMLIQMASAAPGAGQASVV